LPRTSLCNQCNPYTIRDSTLHKHNLKHVAKRKVRLFPMFVADYISLCPLFSIVIESLPEKRLEFV